MKVQARVKEVVESDLVRVDPPVLDQDLVRLAGIHTPVRMMSGRSQGERAHEAMDYVRERLGHGRTVRLETDVEVLDKYRRPLVYLFLDGRNFNAELIRRGLAVMYVLYPNIRYLESFRRAQIAALKSRRGIFSKEGGLTELPYEFRWRAERRTPNKFVADISKGIYVDSTEYKLVRIEDRLFFYDEDDAIAAGFGLVRPGTPDFRRYVEKEYSDFSLEELSAQPMWVLKGITKEQAEAAKKALGLWTVGDLASNRQFNWAKIIKRFSP
jgi:endonuclease YncB( thermonuclease family)